MKIDTSRMYLGSTFSSYEDFDSVFQQWLKEHKHPMRLEPSLSLPIKKDSYAVKTYKYKYVSFHCVHYSVNKNPNLPKSAFCNACVRVSHIQDRQELRITKFYVEHSGHGEGASTENLTNQEQMEQPDENRAQTVEQSKHHDIFPSTNQPAEPAKAKKSRSAEIKKTTKGSKNTKQAKPVATRKRRSSELTKKEEKAPEPVEEEENKVPEKLPKYDIGTQEKYVAELRAQQEANLEALAEHRKTLGLPIVSFDPPPLIKETTPFFMKLSNQQPMSVEEYHEMSTIATKLLRKKLLLMKAEREPSSTSFFPSLLPQPVLPPPAPAPSLLPSTLPDLSSLSPELISLLASTTTTTSLLPPAATTTQDLSSFLPQASLSQFPLSI